MKSIVARKISDVSARRVRGMDTSTLKSYLPTILIELHRSADQFLYHDEHPVDFQVGLDALNALWTEIERREVIPPPTVLVDTNVG